MERGRKIWVTMLAEGNVGSLKGLNFDFPEELYEYIAPRIQLTSGSFLHYMHNLIIDWLYVDT